MTAGHAIACGVVGGLFGWFVPWIADKTRSRRLHEEISVSLERLSEITIFVIPSGQPQSKANFNSSGPAELGCWSNLQWSETELGQMAKRLWDGPETSEKCTPAASVHETNSQRSKSEV